MTDATKAMVASGLIDPKRVAIMGTSFGGFLALSGAAYEPDLYRCAAAISAVSDWSKLIADYRYNKYSNAYFSRMVHKLGDPSKDPEKWDASRRCTTRIKFARRFLLQTASTMRQ